ncbi:hypothetical protein ASD04_07690 [Devosia sp. Root436]|uniref:hypothetical protein n=1 Tax=Devosia sp. Root436 TaxID=1736537 RepID=UPI0006F370DA|nr:hypothetical protein [Devosia sp. Root436]KQX40490.1 hypothetical protein ASD04_07690 [Devosia sp. Root436]
MTTISAGAAAGLLVALMAMSTGDGHSAELLPAVTLANGFVHPGDIRGFNPQPDPPYEARGFDPQPDPPAAFGDGSVRMGDGSVKPAGH